MMTPLLSELFQLGVEPLKMVIDVSRSVQDHNLETLATVEDEVGVVAVWRLKGTFPVDDGLSGDINGGGQRSGCGYDYGIMFGVLSIGFLMAFLLASIMSQVTSVETAIYIGIICLIIIIGIIPLVLAYIDYRRKSAK
jgi:hypothetical protein